jgi:hypothetical protein
LTENISSPAGYGDELIEFGNGGFKQSNPDLFAGNAPDSDIGTLFGCGNDQDHE